MRLEQGLTGCLAAARGPSPVTHQGRCFAICCTILYRTVTGVRNNLVGQQYWKLTCLHRLERSQTKCHTSSAICTQRLAVLWTELQGREFGFGAELEEITGAAGFWVWGSVHPNDTLCPSKYLISTWKVKLLDAGTSIYLSVNEVCEVLKDAAFLKAL